MKKVFVTLAFSALMSMGFAQPVQKQGQQGQQPRPPSWDPRSTEWFTPVPPKVQPGKEPSQAPADAIILFDGKDLLQWEASGRSQTWTTPEPPKCKIENGILFVGEGSGGIRTKEFFGDCQLHIEFRSPSLKDYLPKHQGQARGNSGIMMPGGYEIQVLDGDNNPTYVNGMVGSVYKQSAPLVNAYTTNGEWQVFDIYWKAPKFDSDGTVLLPAMVTVVLNGILVQNNYILTGHTPYTGLPRYTPHGRSQISLQDHGDDTSVAFRNIWVRDL